MLLGLAWIAYLVASNGARMRDAAAGRGPFGRLDVAWATELVALFAFAVVVAVSWIAVRPGSGLGFTEAEANVLFPAPVSRRALVTYKLAQSALGALVVVVAAAAIFGRGGVGGRAISAAAGWIGLLTVTLHGFGASLTRAALAQRGVSLTWRRAAGFAVAAAIPAAGAVGWWRAPPLDAFPAGAAGAMEWTRALAGTAPLSWLLYPARITLDVAFAPTFGALAGALPGAVLVLAIHLAWVYSSDAAFEEASLESARRLSARQDAIVRTGGVQVATRASRRWSVSLAATGRPEVALAWKALLGATRFVSIPIVAAVGALVLSFGTGAVVMSRVNPGLGAAAVAVIAVAFLALAVLLGPFLFSGDLRRDVAHLELLRALPLRGRQVLVGEMALPFVQAAVTQWALVGVSWSCSWGVMPAAERGAVALALALAGPAVSAAEYLVANGLVVLYPEFAGAPIRGATPLDHLGARNVVGLVTVLASAVALVPPAVIGGAVGFAAWPALGAWALPAGALAGAATVAAGAVLSLRVLGRAFERLDLSDGA
jgi:hypothetical protein